LRHPFQSMTEHEFFYFLDEFGIMDLFLGLDPQHTQRSSNVTFPAVILIYVMRIVAGLAFFWHIHPVLLRSQPLMRIVGFNGTQIRNGTSERGKKKTSPAPDSNQNSEETETQDNIRGPLCPDSIAAYIQAIPAHALERLFNGAIAILAAKSFFPKRIDALLDSSEIQSTQACEGCGKVSKEKAPQLRHRKGRIRKVVETVFGFKLWVVWDPVSRLPLAIRFATIEHSDLYFAREVVSQAARNLAPHAAIASLAIDRGFMDGPFLWWLAQSMKIIFYIPAKTNMNVYKDALSLLDTGIAQTRQRKRSVGAGKNKATVMDLWHVVGIEGLISAGFYGEKGSGSHENHSDFIPNPINAVVVVDAPVHKPLKVYDGYDARSEIENTVFREAKQAWFIQRAPRNNASAFRAHVYLTMITMALTTVFQTWMDQQDRLEQAGKETSIRKFRQKVKQENGNKLILFDENRYAIFDTYEVFILCGRTVLMPTGVPETITKKDILLKYGALLE
jgi:hypothetical protein